MKRIRVKPVRCFFVMLICIFVFCGVACAETEEEKILEKVTENIKVEGSDFDFFEESKEIFTGNTDAKNGIFSKILNLLFSSFKENLGLLTKLAALCIVSGIIGVLAGEQASSLCFLACLILITSIAVTVLKNILETAEITIDNLLVLMQSLLPAISMLSLGAEASFIQTFHPSLFASMQVIIFACKEWFLPMTLFVSVLSVINSMTTHFHITKLLETCKLFIKWGLGILMTVYVAFLGIYGFAGAVSAGAVSKTVKYAIGNFIPMVGGVLAESAESVLSGLYLIKSTVGITGVLAILSIAVLPLLNVLATSVVFRLTSSICEPAADKRIITIISDLAGNVSLVFSILLMVCVMFVISIAMLLSVTVTIRT